jgi:hypothetical protein
MLNREQILEAKDIKKETVNVPEWGGKVVVMGMSAEQREEFEKMIGKEKRTERTNIRAKVCQASLVDESGILLFGTEDIAALGKKNAAAMDRCFDVALRLSGITGTEELEKN